MITISTHSWRRKRGQVAEETAWRRTNVTERDRTRLLLKTVPVWESVITPVLCSESYGRRSVHTGTVLLIVPGVELDSALPNVKNEAVAFTPTCGNNKDIIGVSAS